MSESGKYIRRSNRVEQLIQLFHGVTWDGDLISKSDRKELVKAGLAGQDEGWNYITEQGIQFLEQGGFIHP